MAYAKTRPHNFAQAINIHLKLKEFEIAQVYPISARVTNRIWIGSLKFSQKSSDTAPLVQTDDLKLILNMLTSLQRASLKQTNVRSLNGSFLLSLTKVKSFLGFIVSPLAH